jgi:hypothetical protein
LIIKRRGLFFRGVENLSAKAQRFYSETLDRHTYKVSIDFS